MWAAVGPGGQAPLFRAAARAEEGSPAAQLAPLTVPPLPAARPGPRSPGPASEGRPTPQQTQEKPNRPPVKRGPRVTPAHRSLGLGKLAGSQARLQPTLKGGPAQAS